MSDGWFTCFGFRIPADKISCAGCLSPKNETLDVGCPVRPCVIARKLDNCAYCPEYACEKLQDRLVTLADMESRAGYKISDIDRTNFILPYENLERLETIRASIKQD